MDLIVAIAGLLVLLVAGDWLVKGAVNLSLRLGVPALIVSLTVVSFGTSAPELLIAIGAVLRDAPGIALGNVVGSNTANVLLVLGLPALIWRVECGEVDTRRSYLMMLVASVLFIAVCFTGPITWVHGIVLLAALAAILVAQAHESRSQSRNDAEVDLEGADPSISSWMIVGYLVLGLVGLPLGAQLLIGASVNIATDLGVSETVIGLTLVAVGTSLPELATTMVAAWRGHAAVALGNVIGSNIFNLLGIVGVTALIGRIPVDPAFLNFDLWIMLAAALVMAPFVLRGLCMGRVVGAALVALYAGYVFILLV